MRDWEEGIAIGPALERLKHLGRRTDQLEEGQKDIRKDIAGLKRLQELFIRGAIVVSLWGGTALLVLPADKVGEAAASFVRSMLSKSISRGHTD